MPKTIHAVGDSHAGMFGGIQGIVTFKNLGFTMYRIGRDGLPKNLPYNGNNLVVFCFGEIDIRCHVKPQSEKQGKSPEEVIDDLVSYYFKSIEKKQKEVGFECYVSSVTPPAYKATGNENKQYPFIGPDEERSYYTKYINSIIKQKCEEMSYSYLNIYDLYSDGNGMLIYKLSDKHVHIKDNNGIKDLLLSLGLIQDPNSKKRKAR